MMEGSARMLAHLRPRRCVKSAESCVSDCSRVKTAEPEALKQQRPGCHLRLSAIFILPSRCRWHSRTPAL